MQEIYQKRKDMTNGESEEPVDDAGRRWSAKYQRDSPPMSERSLDSLPRRPSLWMNTGSGEQVIYPFIPWYC